MAPCDGQRLLLKCLVVRKPDPISNSTRFPLDTLAPSLWRRTMLRRTTAPFSLRALHSLFLASSSFASSFSSQCKRRSLNSPSVQPPEPPKKIPLTVSAHGRSWEDPYHWMRNTGDQDLVDYLKRENDYTEAYMSDTCGLRRRLIAEMKGRMPATVATPPEPWGTW